MVVSYKRLSGLYVCGWSAEKSIERCFWEDLDAATNISIILYHQYNLHL